MKEEDIIAAMHNEYGGKRNVRCRNGTIDIVNTEAKVLVQVCEVSAWLADLGQLICAGADFPGYRRELFLYKSVWSDPVHSDTLKVIKRACDRVRVDLRLHESIHSTRPKQTRRWWNFGRSSTEVDA